MKLKYEIIILNTCQRTTKQPVFHLPTVHTYVRAISSGRIGPVFLTKQNIGALTHICYSN